MSITITLNQLKEHRPSREAWKKLLIACGGEDADINRPIPLTEILDLTDLNTTLWCFICPPEHEHILTEFALICAQTASVYSKDERVHDCVRTLENYLKGDASPAELRVAQASIQDFAYSDAGIVATKAAETVYLAASYLLDSGFHSVNNAAEAAAEAAAYSYKTHQHDTDAYNAEKHRQVNLLRMLLED